MWVVGLTDACARQDTLLPSPTRCYQLLEKYVPELALRKQGELTQEIKARRDSYTPVIGDWRRPYTDSYLTCPST